MLESLEEALGCTHPVVMQFLSVLSPLEEYSIPTLSQSWESCHILSCSPLPQLSASPLACEPPTF